jgi:hypothetical protein
MKRYSDININSLGRIFSCSRYLLFGLSLLFISNLLSLKAQCPNGITNYWTFNTDNPSITRDTIGTCDGSSGINSSTAPVGQVGKASNFNGSRYVNFPDYPSYAWTTSLSVTLWCNFTYLSDLPMVMIGYDRTGSTHWWIGAEASTGRPTFYLYDDTRTGDGVVGPSAINNNSWHFMAATYNASNSSLRLYIDGVLVADSTQTYSNPFTVDSDLGMGAMYRDAAWKYFYTGLLDEVALYNRALTVSEITQLYTKGLSKGSYCLQQTSKPVFISQPELGVQLGETYIYDVEATGLPDPTYSLIISQPGMTINDITGIITWNPVEAGTYNVLVQAMNIAGNTNQAFSVKVVNPCINKMLTYFTFEEDYGDITFDDAYFIQGTLYNDPLWGSGIKGSGLTFDGIDQYMSFSDDQGNYDWPVGKSFTFELWCQSQESLNELQVMLSRGTAASSNWWISTVSSSGNAAFFLYDAAHNGDGLIGTSSINDGEWHHIVGVRDAATGYNMLYVDGRLEADSVITYSSSFVSASDVQVANYLDGSSHKYFFNGTLDEIAIYERALTSAEITEHYTKGVYHYGYCGNFTLAPDITSSAVTRCYVNQEYIYQVVALGVPAPTFNLSGAPAGISINTFTGKISGIPTIPGEYTMTITASASGSDVQIFTLEVLESCIGKTSFYFDFEEAEGDVIYDAFSPREGYLVNSPERTDGLVGNAIQFNGIDERAFILKEEEYDWLKNQSFTIELWCLPGAVTEELQVMIGRDVPGSTQWWMGTWRETGVPVFYLYDSNRDGGGVVGRNSIHDGSWHHVAAVRNGTSGHTLLFVDGELQADSVRTYANDFAADVNLQVANLYQDYNRYFYEGKLDEIAIYKRALTADEIRGHFRHGLSGLNYCDAARLGPYIILEPFH